MRFRQAMAAAGLAFALGAVAGYLKPWLDIAAGLAGSVSLEFWPLFLHNLRAALLIYLASLAYIGLLLVALNGYVLGTAVTLGLSVGLTPIQVTAAIAPHGIIEIPAFLAAAALGLTTRRYFKESRLSGALRIAAGLAGVTAMLAIAAMIEVEVTPRILRATGVDLPQD